MPKVPNPEFAENSENSENVELPFEKIRLIYHLDVVKQDDPI